MSSVNSPWVQRAALGVILMVFTALVFPRLLDDSESNYSWDESKYHLPTIEAIDTHWPTLDLVNDCKSAIAPGLHYLLATVAQVTGPDQRAMRLTNFVISVGCLIFLFGKLKSLPLPTAGAALACLAGSSFYLKSAAFVFTDNAALFAITLTLSMTLSLRAPNRIIGIAVLVSLAIFIRQNSAWLLLLLAWISVDRLRAHAKWDRRFVKIVSPLILPLVTLLWLIISWRGLVPPAWQNAHYVSGFVTFSGALYALSLMGIYAGPFLWAAGRIPRSGSEIPKVVWLVAIVTFVVVLITPMNASEEDGRWGGYLWMLANHTLPDRAEFLVFSILAPIGAGASVLLFRSLSDKLGTLWILAYSGWLISALPNRQVFQRYFEPVTIVFLILWLIHVVPRPNYANHRGLVLLATLQILVSTVVLYLR